MMLIHGKVHKEYNFEGPYLEDKLEDKSGVYAIIDKLDAKYHLLDIGESANVKTRIHTHDRKNCWNKHKQGILLYYVCYTSNAKQEGRKQIEQDVRNYYNLVCGKE